MKGIEEILSSRDYSHVDKAFLSSLKDNELATMLRFYNSDNKCYFCNNTLTMYTFFPHILECYLNHIKVFRNYFHNMIGDQINTKILEILDIESTTSKHGIDDINNNESSLKISDTSQNSNHFVKVKEEVEKAEEDEYEDEDEDEDENEDEDEDEGEYEDIKTKRSKLKKYEETKVQDHPLVKLERPTTTIESPLKNTPTKRKFAWGTIEELNNSVSCYHQIFSNYFSDKHAN